MKNWHECQLGTAKQSDLKIHTLIDVSKRLVGICSRKQELWLADTFLRASNLDFRYEKNEFIKRNEFFFVICKWSLMLWGFITVRNYTTRTVWISQIHFSMKKFQSVEKLAHIQTNRNNFILYEIPIKSQISSIHNWKLYCGVCN